MGYLLTWGEEGRNLLERDTVSCNHCQKVLAKATWRDDGGWCFSCGRPVCIECFGRLHGPPGIQQKLIVNGTPLLINVSGCRPFKKHIDEAWDLLNKYPVGY